MLAIGLVDICQLVANGLFIFFGLLNVEYSRDFEKVLGKEHLFQLVFNNSGRVPLMLPPGTCCSCSKCCWR